LIEDWVKAQNELVGEIPNVCVCTLQVEKHPRKVNSHSDGESVVRSLWIVEPFNRGIPLPSAIQEPARRIVKDDLVPLLHVDLMGHRIDNEI
jgi:hypothetical protein